MPHQEMILRRETLSRGRVFTHERWQVRLENGGTAEREMILHPGGVGIVAVDEQGRLLMVRQYRSGAGAETLEIPAGKLDAGEDPATGALRELREEVGVEPGDFRPMGSFIAAPGCYGEILHLYLARDLKMETQDLDPDEFLNVERIPFDEMVRRCMDGEVEDAKTVAAVLKAKLLLGL